MVDHLYKATTGCIIKITLVALAFDDRVILSSAEVFDLVIGRSIGQKSPQS